jgi:hypothetical protein
MSSTDAIRALNQASRIRQFCDFVDHPVIRKAIDDAVPVTMPRDLGSLGLDVSLLIGLGIVGLWSALDAYASRAPLTRVRNCSTCGSKCITARFNGHLVSPLPVVLDELDDLQHLYAHNFAGEADATYLNFRTRHVLRPGAVIMLSCGYEFNGSRVSLEVDHLRHYADHCRTLIQKFLG